MAKSGSEPVNLPGARPLMNPLKVLHYHIPVWYKRLIYLQSEVPNMYFFQKKPSLWNLIKQNFDPMQCKPLQAATSPKT